jgi:hypothetical protein
MLYAFSDFAQFGGYLPDVHTTRDGRAFPMKRFARLELAVVLTALVLGMVGYLLQSSTLDFFAVVSGAFGAALVVARGLLSP